MLSLPVRLRILGLIPVLSRNEISRKTQHSVRSENLRRPHLVLQFDITPGLDARGGRMSFNRL